MDELRIEGQRSNVVLDDLLACRSDQNFVEFFNKQVETWVSEYRSQIERIRHLEQKIRPNEKQARSDKIELSKQLAKMLDYLAQDGPQKGSLAEQFRTALTKNRTLKHLQSIQQRFDQDIEELDPELMSVLSSGIQSHRLTNRDRMLIWLHDDLQEMQQILDGQEWYDEIYSITTDPNSALATKIDFADATVTMDRLRLDTKCLIVGLWVRRKVGCTKLLSVDASDVSFDGSSGCKVLATLGSLDDWSTGLEIHDPDRLNEIGRECLRAYSEKHPHAAYAKREGLQCGNDHSEDFRSLRWFGRSYRFTANQAPVVRVLYDHFMRGVPDLSTETLLSAIDPEGPPERLDTVFRGSDAWGTIIVSESKGTRRLSEPKSSVVQQM